MVYGWLVLTFPFSLPIPLILTFGSSRAKIFLWLSGYNINIPLVYSLVYLLVLFSKDGHHRTPHPHDLIIHHAINILILGGDVYVPFPWIWEELVTSLTRRQRKWCCANFWANTFRNSQFPIPVLWDTESRKSATMQGETKYPLEEALCGCSDQQPLLSSQPIASTNCQACEWGGLQMIPASSYWVTLHFPTDTSLWSRDKLSTGHISKSLIHRIQKHNKMVPALYH